MGITADSVEKRRHTMDLREKLYRSETDKMICGVCAGIGEYLNLDPTVVRLLWVLFSMMGGAGLLAYIIAAIIIPEE